MILTFILGVILGSVVMTLVLAGLSVLAYRNGYEDCLKDLEKKLLESNN